MKILYLHNKTKWALHNVGLQWSHLRTFSRSSFDFADYHNFSNLQDLDGQYDFIWFCLYIYEKYMYDPAKSIVTLHDPLELFTQDPDWRLKNIPIDKLSTLKQIKHLTVISKELQQLLERHGVHATLTSTGPQVPACRTLPQPKELSYLAVTNIYPRKNIELLEDVANNLNYIGMRGTLKLGDKILSKQEYIKLLDSHQVYICTSYQEGGPLPAMEAMARGQVVLTTPVGQLIELVNDGYNGFFCSTKEDFVEKAMFLKNNPKAFIRMSMNARSSIAKLRSNTALDEQMSIVLKSIEEKHG